MDNTLFGALNKYANSALREQESHAWENVVKEKYQTEQCKDNLVLGESKKNGAGNGIRTRE